MTFLISSRTGLTEPRRRLLALYLLVIDGEREDWKGGEGGARFVLTASRYHPRVISYTESTRFLHLLYLLTKFVCASL